jgi:hypothetical protein
LVTESLEITIFIIFLPESEKVRQSEKARHKIKEKIKKNLQVL